MPRKKEGSAGKGRGRSTRARKAGGASARDRSDDVARQSRAGNRRASGTRRAAAGRKRTSKRRPAAARRQAGPKAAGKRRAASSSRRSTTAAPRKRSAASTRARTTVKSSARKSASRTRSAQASRRTKSKTAARSGSGRARGRRQASAPRGGYSTSTRRALWIESPEQHAERSGQTLATRNHDVIRQWAEERGAVPATVPGTERDGRPGVLRFDFPDFGGARLRAVDWDEWFETFDERRLVFLFQEQMKSGSQSNFFRLDSPDREEG